MIELNNVSLKYVKDKYTLYDINLSFEEGNIYEIVGDELSSKNVLLRVIAGLVPCTEGQVLWEGQDILTIPVRDRRIGYIDDNLAFLRHKSVLYNLYYVLKIRKIPRVQALSMIETCLEQNKLTYLKDKKISKLTKVEQIKVAILRVKLVNRRILLVEDIWKGLTSKEIDECLSMLQSACSTIIFATTKPRIDSSVRINLKWGNVISHE